MTSKEAKERNLLTLSQLIVVWVEKELEILKAAQEYVTMNEFPIEVASYIANLDTMFMTKIAENKIAHGKAMLAKDIMGAYVNIGSNSSSS